MSTVSDSGRPVRPRCLIALQAFGDADLDHPVHGVLALTQPHSINRLVLEGEQSAFSGTVRREAARESAHSPLGCSHYSHMSPRSRKSATPFSKRNAAKKGFPFSGGESQLDVLT